MTGSFGTATLPSGFAVILLPVAGGVSLSYDAMEPSSSEGRCIAQARALQGDRGTLQADAGADEHVQPLDRLDVVAQVLGRAVGRDRREREGHVAAERDLEPGRQT